jgi:hypothetical protein
VKFPAPAPRLARREAPPSLSDAEQPATSLRMQVLFTAPHEDLKN